MTEIPYVRQPIEFPARYEHGPDSFVSPVWPAAGCMIMSGMRAVSSQGRGVAIGSTCPRSTRQQNRQSLMVFQDADWYLDLTLRFVHRSCSTT